MREVSEIGGGMHPPTHAGLVVAALARRQHGVVARRQLLGRGMSETAVRERMRSRLLIPLHAGVYAVGHDRLRREGRWLAAVLAAGPGAVLSHRDAAALHDLRPSNREWIEVTTRRQRVSRRPVRVHRARHLGAADVTVVEGVPVTTVARTLVDLAGVVPADHLGKALEAAERLGRLDVAAVEAALARTRGRRGGGHAAMRAALAELRAAGTTLTRSELEDRFLALLDARGVPRPLGNGRVEGIEVDAVWRDARLAVELDGYAFHRSRRAFQRDRDRANALVRAGWRVVRFTHDDVVRRPGQVADDVLALIR